MTSIGRVLLLAVALYGTLSDVRDSQAQGRGQEQSVLDFHNPPLQYRGPDPLAQQFLPASATLGGSGSLLPPDLPASQYLLPQGTLPPSALSETPFPGGSIETYLPPEGSGEIVLGDPYNGGPLITDHKDGFFQKVKLTGTWIDRNDKFDDFGLTEVDLFASFAVPLPTREWPLLISPTFKVRSLNGPSHVDLPPTIYETFLDFLWLPRLSARWTAILGVAPGVYSDFEADDDDAFRITGTGLMRYDWTPGRTQLIFGVLYLNRDDVQLLPAGGIIWTPDADRRYEILFPKPKLAHRIAIGSHFEDWIYLGGEFGGNSYLIQRVSGATETITLRDFRTYLGLERKLGGGAGYHLEIGYVMGRTIEFQSMTPDVKADPTAMIRGGVSY